VGLVVTEPALPCTSAQPCGTSLALAVMLASLIVGLVGLHLAPAIALVALPLAGWLQLTQGPESAGYGMWLVPSLLLVSTASAGYAARVLRGRRRQRTIAADAARAGAFVVVPDALRPTPRWVLRAGWPWVGGAAAAVVLAIGLVGYAGFAWNADADHAASATVETAVVRSADAEGFVLEVVMPDESVRSLETIDASMYPIGSQVEVLVDGEWARLAAEPCDATFSLAGAMTLLVAAAAVARAVALGVRAASDAAHPHLALRALVGQDAQGRALVWAADAGPADFPLFRFQFDAYGEDDPIDTDADLPESLPDLELLAHEFRRRDAAILHATPREGAYVPVEVHPAEGEPVLLVPTGPVKRIRGHHEPVAAPVEQILAGRREAVRRMGTAAIPRTYQLPAPVRVVVLVAWVCMLAGGMWLVSDPEVGSALAWLGVWTLGLWFSWDAVMAWAFTVVADSSGVHLRAASGWRHRPWDDLALAESTSTSVILHTHKEGQSWETSGIPGAAWLRRVGVSNPADRCADEINAMITDPSLRPLTSYQPNPTWPLVILLALAMLTWTAAIATGLVQAAS
jgi:hypothetical protein